MIRISLVTLLIAGMSSAGVARAAGFTEDFSSDPLQHGWKIFGDTNLFKWDSSHRALQVTWDSSRSNSYFFHSLGTVLTRADDFQINFDLLLTDIGPGPDTNKATSFPIALGFLNLDQATGTNFIRGTGSDSPNLAEFSYFWDSGFGATTWPVMVDTNSTFNYNSPSDYAILALVPGDPYHIGMSFTASNQTLVATVTNTAQNTGVRITQPINSAFGDYRLGSFSLSSYSDSGQNPPFAGSVLAHGSVANISVTVPPAPLQSLANFVSNGTTRIQFLGLTNWIYSLEKTSDFRTWAAVPGATSRSAGMITLSDTNASSAAFYRVRASRP